MQNMHDCNVNSLEKRQTVRIIPCDLRCRTTDRAFGSFNRSMAVVQVQFSF